MPNRPRFALEPRRWPHTSLCVLFGAFNAERIFHFEFVQICCEGENSLVCTNGRDEKINMIVITKKSFPSKISIEI